MRRKKTRLAGALAVLLSVVAVAAGCGLQTAGGYVPSGKLIGELEDVDLSGVEISVGSKNFNENIILGKMVLILAKSAGAEVDDLTNIPGSAAARQAHVDGDIDAMWEYTGTGWLQYLEQPKAIAKEDPEEQKKAQWEATRDLDLKENDLVWLPPAPMNNTYAFAITQASVKKYGVTKLSDIGKLPVADRTLCVESEFKDRNDGLEGMLNAYDIPLGKGDGIPLGNLQEYQTGAVYDALDSGNCVFGEVFTTDGRILSLDLEVLEDDRKYFPSYNVSLVVRKDFYDKHPEIEDLMAPITEKLTDKELLDMNARVDVDGESPGDVAWEWLVDNGFVEEEE